MCKYANNGIVKVCTEKQVTTIKKVLNTTTTGAAQRPVQKTKFNMNLWTKNNVGNTVAKG